MKKIPLLLFILALQSVISCYKPPKQKTVPVVLVENPERVNEEVAELLEEQLSDLDTSKILVTEYDSLFTTKLIVEIYRENNFHAIWSDKGIHNQQSDSLFDLIKKADEYGLISNDYHFSKIARLRKTEKDPKTKKFDAVKISNEELLLTDAFFTFVVHVSQGRLNVDSLIREWKLAKLLSPPGPFEKTNRVNLVEVLNNAITQNNIRAAIDSLEPKNSQYQALKSALKNFKLEFRGSDWDSLAAKESNAFTFKKRLKERLIASHDYAETPGDSDSTKLDRAIKNFQCRHNLDEDGVVGKLTFKALQRTRQDYIDQIQVNMERWRYYYAPYEKRFVWVNIPKYEMRVMEKDTMVMKSRVIVGHPEHQTPLLKSTIRYFIIYPYWNVPYSIATKEILPLLKRDTSYLRRKKIDVLDRHNRIVDTTIKWKKYNEKYFPWKLRQRIGEENSLGILKFNFSNKYGVYLHDTDNRRLFNREMRAMSHGCVRLERFFDFARFLIREDSIKYPIDSLEIDLLKEEQKYVYIKRPITIYINYFTAEVDANNELFFFMDVYKRDEKMLKALSNR